MVIILAPYQEGKGTAGEKASVGVSKRDISPTEVETTKRAFSCILLRATGLNRLNNFYSCHFNYAVSALIYIALRSIPA